MEHRIYTTDIYRKCIPIHQVLHCFLFCNANSVRISHFYRQAKNNNFRMECDKLWVNSTSSDLHNMFRIRMDKFKQKNDVVS